MHIIIMSDHLGSRSRSIHIDRRLGLLISALALATIGLIGLFGYLIAIGGPEIEANRPLAATSEQIDQLAKRVGELRARQDQLTDIGERVSAKVGVPLPDTLKGHPGRGGPMPNSTSQPMTTAEDLDRVMNQISQRLELMSDQLMVLNAELQLRNAKQGKVALDSPVNVTSHISSVFGSRIDPFTGQLTRHAGLDFADAPGAPIMAAESGVVLDAKMHPQYGYMVEVDHGNGMSTRYAHLSKILVTKGTIVKRGQQIAEMGSTGRSTGPHLHFEVLKHGVQQNPMLYLYGRS